MTQIEVVKEKVFSIGEQLDEVILLLRGKSEHLTENEKLLATPLEDEEISTRALNVCHGNGLYTIGDITRVSEAYMCSLRNCGKRTLQELKGLLELRGLHFGMHESV